MKNPCCSNFLSIYCLLIFLLSSIPTTLWSYVTLIHVPAPNCEVSLRHLCIFFKIFCLGGRMNACNNYLCSQVLKIFSLSNTSSHMYMHICTHTCAHTHTYIYMAKRLFTKQLVIYYYSQYPFFSAATQNFQLSMNMLYSFSLTINYWLKNRHLLRTDDELRPGRFLPLILKVLKRQRE